MPDSAPRQSERLVVLLHGMGGTGSSLMPVADSWRHLLPNTRFAAPNAPFAGDYGYGYQWFGADARQLRPDRLAAVRQAFDTVIRDVLNKEGFIDRTGQVAFVGVSQGAIMALDALASNRWRIGALVSFAGLLSPVAVSSAGKDTPVLLVHGGLDRTIPPVASEVAARQLRAAGFSVTLDILPDVGHTVTPEGGRKALDFLTKSAFLASTT